MIFTGEQNGTVIVKGDLLLDKGIVKAIGRIPGWMLDQVENLTTVNANNAWITPGLVDLHSNLGVLSSPMTTGANDLTSKHGPVLPWLRSIDGFDTHDDSFELAIAGGVTSALILPGSANAIGGQAFMIKLRKTAEKSPSSMIVEPPHSLDGSQHNPENPRWRHLQQTCGENLRRYGNRMDSVWALRSAYSEARKVMMAQDAYCLKAEAGLWDSLGNFPDNPKWEMLVDVLRGRVKIFNQCYEVVDLDGMIRLSNEFKFPIASFHHASEAWLVPELLKRTWGETPAIAAFATNHRHKREAFRGSEFAPRILSDAGISVILKSDHPVVNSRYLVYEAQQAHYFGLPDNLSLAAVTSAPATAAGLSHRIGILKEGADADVVIWDSHPLQLAATPVKIWIDGVLQIPVPSKTNTETRIEVGKGKEGDEWRKVPDVPKWDKERKDTILWEGLPPLQGKLKDGRIVFNNVKHLLRRGIDGSIEVVSDNGGSELGVVIVVNGRIECVGASCLSSTGTANMVDLHGGSISPGLMSFGSPLGLEEIAAEPSTGDGELHNAFVTNIPDILDDSGGVLRAMDALMFHTRNALTAYRSGVTFATSSLAKPVYLGGLGPQVISGLSTTFRTGSAHAMERGAIIQDIAALHVTIGRAHPLLNPGVSVSTQISGLRRLLYGWESTHTETGFWFRKAAEGVVPLVIEVENADIMATLLILKAEVEYRIGSRMRMVFSGAAEAHLIAKELGMAGVGVILNPARPFPSTWDQHRILPGPPLSNDTALVTLINHAVTVGLGVREAWQARNTRFDIQWAILESNGRINQKQAYALVSTNLEKLLGIRAMDDEDIDMVAYEGGGIFDLSSKVVAVISARRHGVDFF